jgi:hypothetical protein
MNRGILILHIIPLSAFDMTSALSLLEIERDFGSFVPIGSSTANGARINFDGVLKTSNADSQATQHRAYVQLFRNGIIETVHSTLLATSSGTPIISNLDDRLIHEIMRSLNDLAAVGIEPPYALLVSRIGVAGARFNFARVRYLTRWRMPAEKPHRQSSTTEAVTFRSKAGLNSGKRARDRGGR